MHLKLEELQRVVKRTIKEERRSASLREELFRVLGPSVMVSSNLTKVAVVANEQLDLLEATGRAVPAGSIRTSVLMEAMNSNSSDLRKLAARLLPAKMITRLLEDTSSNVRCAAAKRLPYSLVKESVKRHPGDDQLRTIARAKRLNEAGLPTPKSVTEPFDMYGDKPLGDAVKTQPGEDMPDSWYERLAHKLNSVYGTNLEGQWEEVLANRVAASHASTGSEIDRDKLLKAIKKVIKDREDTVVKEGSLRGIAKRLLSESYLDDAVMPVIEESHNPVKKLLESGYSSARYVEEAEKVFKVRKSYIPAGIKKYRLGEGHHNVETQVPMKAAIPQGTPSEAAEKALDAYVSNWNKQQALTGEPYKLSWSNYPTDINLVGFNLELK